MATDEMGLPRRGPSELDNRIPADSGRIERVTLPAFVCGECGLPSENDLERLADEPIHYCLRHEDEPGREDRPEMEAVTFIPESTHYSEIERLAGELKARATEYRESDGPDGDDAYWNACSDALIGAAKLLRDSVPASLTRGES